MELAAVYLSDVEAHLDRADNRDWTTATTREEAEEALALLDWLWHEQAPVERLEARPEHR